MHGSVAQKFSLAKGLAKAPRKLQNQEQHSQGARFLGKSRADLVPGKLGEVRGRPFPWAGGHPELPPAAWGDRSRAEGSWTESSDMSQDWRQVWQPRPPLDVPVACIAIQPGPQPLV